MNTELSQDAKYMQIVKQTFEERKEMYMQLSLESLMSMITERMKYPVLHTKESLASVLAYWEQFYSPISCK